LKSLVRQQRVEGRVAPYDGGEQFLQ
jgi:hypothetical protein